MSSPRWNSLMRRVSFLFFVGTLAAAFANAQSSPYSNPFSSSLFMAGESSSNEFHLVTGSSLGDPASRSAATSASGGSGAGAAQEYGRKRAASRGMAFDFGGGFNAPIGNDTSSKEGGPFITWGGNLTAGAGLRFTRNFSLLGEFQYIDNKLPGKFIAEAGFGATNGSTHIFSLTAAPVIDLFPSKTNSLYLTGGGGYYHKSTNFSIQVCCDFTGYPVSINTNSFSSNQVGGNFGFGITRRLGGVYGDGQMKLFGEARYLFLKTPPIGETNGLGTTELIPVTFGVRW